MKKLKKLSVRSKLIITAVISALLTSSIWMTVSANNSKLELIDTSDPNFEAMFPQEEVVQINMVSEDNKGGSVNKPTTTTTDSTKNTDTKKKANTISTVRRNGCTIRGKFYNDGDEVYLNNYGWNMRMRNQVCTCMYKAQLGYGVTTCRNGKK